MKLRNCLLALVATTPTWIHAAQSVSETASLTPMTITAALAEGAWMDGGKLLVSGASLGLHTEKDAKLFAVRNAASKAADFLDKKQIAEPALVRRAIEDSILRETPIEGLDFGDARIEDLCQEQWKDENGRDSWSITLTLSLRLGKGKGH